MRIRGQKCGRVFLAILLAFSARPTPIFGVDGASVDSPAKTESANPTEEPVGDLTPGAWKHRDSVTSIAKSLLAKGPTDRNGVSLTANPGRPFTYEEQVYDKPNRDWWWNAGEFAVILIGGGLLTYFTGGVVAPYVGSLIGGMAGLSGAAAVSYGLAILGGGAIAAGGFGVAGGTVVVGIVTDLAISTALEYSLGTLKTTEGLAALDKAIRVVDANHDEPAAWETLRIEADKAAKDPRQYVVAAHAMASAFLRWAADENIERLLAAKNGHESEMVVSDRQRILMTAAIALLEETRRLQPHSSLIHHALGNAYWWLSVRGGYEEPEKDAVDLPLPASARMSISGKDEAGCFQSALWHYAEGSACEPRNVNVRISWANSLQADGTLHEAIAVIAAALPHISECRDEDKARLLRTSSMLQYQAFTRSPLWQRFTSGSPFPSLQDSPLLMAAMQGYTKVLTIDPGDVGSLTSLAQIYREAEPTKLDTPPSILALKEVQFRLVESLLKQEQTLADMKRSALPASYKPGQLLEQYKDLLEWAFKGVGRDPLKSDDLKRIHTAVDGWLNFASVHHVTARPFDRDLVLRVQRMCKAYNDKAWADYSLTLIDEELVSRPSESR